MAAEFFFPHQAQNRQRVAIGQRQRSQGSSPSTFHGRATFCLQAGQ
jgi:hypothetical protein